MLKDAALFSGGKERVFVTFIVYLYPHGTDLLVVMPCSKPLPRPCLRASREDAQMLNKPWPAAKLCIIFDRLDCLQDANQPQIKSSTKLMSNHILSVQLDIITWELIFHRRGKTDFSR